MWIVAEDAEADVASDLSAFHRIDDVSAIDGPRYFYLAQRVSCYAGVRAAVLGERDRREREGVDGGSSSTSKAPKKVSDDAALASISDGWVEHRKQGV